MSLHLRTCSRRLFLKPILYRHQISNVARYTTSSSSTDNNPLDGSKNKVDHPASSSKQDTPPPTPPTKQHDQQETPVQKSIIATKAYLEKLQHDMKPRLEPYIMKLNNASEQLKRLTSDVSDSKEALQRASRALNELTGYDQIDAVKQKVNNQATLFETTRDQVQAAKRAYEDAIETRSTTQRGINELLQRKHLWTGDDVTKFTELYRLEHAHSQAETVAKEKYQACEKQMDREYMELARSIMERYHEEQLWSDKIRSVSTYGTWALMVVNLLLFVAVQTVFEPRKRKRLTDRFEELLVAKVDEEEQKFKGVFEALDEKDRLLMQQQVAVMETLNALAEHPLFDEETLASLKRTQEKEEERAGVMPVPIAPVLSPVMVAATEDTANQEQDMPTTPLIPDESTTPVAKEENKIRLENEELRKLLLLSPANFDDAPFYKEQQPTAAVSTIPSLLSSSLANDETIAIGKRDFVLYSIDCALVGGLLTAITVYFLR
ncbi:Mdm33 family-domain-containing protein [Mucor lusitanicus]|nr:Mdm33 family-domain-containing protein [Mucor lusitanicus]